MCYLKPPDAGGLWGEHAGVEGAEDGACGARFQICLNVRQTL